MWRPVGSLAVVILLVWSPAGCSAKHQRGTPVVSVATSRSSAASDGDGTASVSVGAVSKNFDVTCTRNGTTIQATGNDGADELSLTVGGSPMAVLVSHGADGSTTIYQAIPGLRDDSGKASASVSVTPNGDSYKGTATFVLTRIDSKGSRSRSATGNTDSGTFEVQCTNGYLSPPASSSAPSGSATPSGTATH